MPVLFISINDGGTNMNLKKLGIVAFVTFWATLNSSAYVATGNPTASGLYPREGITCAANYINGIYVPFGTVIILPDGSKLYVEDRMHPDYGHDAVDIFMNSKSKAIQWGRRSIRCQVIVPD